MMPVHHAYVHHSVYTQPSVQICRTTLVSYGSCRPIEHPQERDVLLKYRGSRFFLMQTWSLRLAAEQIAKPDSRREDAAVGADLRSFEQYALSLRSHGAAISDLLEQPIPFPMYHTLMLMLNFSLTLKAYAMIEANSLMSVPTYFVICFICLGLKETAVALSDPFGMDAVDFETDVFMARIMINTKELTVPDG